MWLPQNPTGYKMSPVGFFNGGKFDTFKTRVKTPVETPVKIYGEFKGGVKYRPRFPVSKHSQGMALRANKNRLRRTWPLRAPVIANIFKI